jgi:hypothetical protein
VFRRTVENTYSADSRDAIIECLEDNGFRRATSDTGHVEFASGAGTQGVVFRAGVKRFTDYLDMSPVRTPYALVAEVMLTRTRRGGEGVGGIQCYILDSDGKNVFSFVLNAHHRVFAAGELVIPSLNPRLRRQLEERATDVLVEALGRQLGGE